MAFNPAPTAWIPSYTSDGTNLTIPRASLPGLTTAEAHTSTGDIRSIALSLIDRLFQVYNASATADRPARMTLRRSTTESGGTVRRAYTVEFQLDSAVADVAAE